MPYASSESAYLTEGDFSLEEIKEAMFGLGGDTGPGPYGFSILFLQ